MNMGERVTVGEMAKYPLGLIDEASAVGHTRILRHRPGLVEDQDRKRLMLLSQELDDLRARARKRQPLDLDLRCQSRERGQQSFNLVAMWADEEPAGLRRILKSRPQQEETISTDGRSPT